MAAVKNVEAAVGEDQRPTLGMKPVSLGAHFGGFENAREELGKGLGRVHEVCWKAGIDSLWESSARRRDCSIRRR